MPSMVERMLEQAAEMLDRHPGSKAAKRRAVSSAYYAVFHRLMEVCADAVLPDADPASGIYVKVYRALDHGPLKNAFKQAGPLRDHVQIRSIGEAVVELQSARMKADYLPAGYDPEGEQLFSTADVKRHLAQALRTIDRIDDLNAEDRRIIAIHLLFKDRSRD